MNWEEAVEQLRRQPDQEELVRACYYDDPLHDAAIRFFESEEWVSTRELLGTRRGRALDVGAGRGIASYALARDGWNVVSLEPDPSHVVGSGAIRRLATESKLDWEVVSGIAEGLPFETASFDLVYGRAVLHHARDLKRFCSELGRVLKPGGLLVAVREHVVSTAADLPRFLENHPLHRHYGGEHAYLLEEYEAALLGSGIELARVITPLGSPINFHPRPAHEIRDAIARRLRLPSFLVGPRLMNFAGKFDRTPGRHYSFVGRKTSRSASR